MRLFLATLLLLIGGVFGYKEQELRKKLLENYDKTALPAKCTNLTLSFTILHVDLDEDKQVVSLDAWVRMGWTDPRLVWNSATYSDIDRLAFPDTDIWTPDLTLYTNARNHISDHMASYLVLAFPDGKIIHVPTANLPSPCVLDMTYWPYDRHVCSLKLGSWVYHGNILNIDRKPEQKDIEYEPTAQVNGISRGAWNLVNSSLTFQSKFYDCCPEPYVSATLELVLERKQHAYCWMVKVPAIVLTAVTGVLFLLPVGSTVKVVVGAVIMVLDLQFLVMTRTVVKHSASHTPLIVKLISEQLVITFLCVLVSTGIIRIAKGPHTDSPPNYLQKLVSLLEKPFCLGSYRAQVKQSGEKSYSNTNVVADHQPSEDKEVMMMESGNSVNMFQAVAASEWLMFGALLDKCLFVVYSVAFCIKLIRYSAVI